MHRNHTSLWASRHDLKEGHTACVFCHWEEPILSHWVLLFNRGAMQVTLQVDAHEECVAGFAAVLGAEATYHEGQTE